MGNLRKSTVMVCFLISALCGCHLVSAQPPEKSPPVKALVTNFYYHDLHAARNWYADALGLPVIYDDGWVVMVEAEPGMQIALVDGARGALKPVENKGAMLAIETDALEEWYQRVKNIDGITWYPYNNEDPNEFVHGIREHKDYEEFRILDPGGYILEFYRWKPGYQP